MYPQKFTLIREDNSKVDFREMCELLDIDKTRTTPYHPQSDGMVERFNRTLTTVLSAYVNEHHRDWDKQIPYIMMAYRSAEHETTGVTPNMSMFGREVRTPLDLVFEIPSTMKAIPTSEWVWELRERMEMAHTMIRRNTGTAMQRQKQIHDRKTSYESFEPGDKVFVYFPVKKVGTSSKFTSFWRGPYTILRKMSCVLYEVDCDRYKVGQVVHCDRIRRCRAQLLLGEDHSLLEESCSNRELESNTIDKGDEPSLPPEHDIEFQDFRTRRKPVWAKDYVFSIFREKMPNLKITPRKALGVCSCCMETINGDLTAHIKVCPKRLPCTLCKKTFLKVAYLRKHMMDTHKNVSTPGNPSASGSGVESENDESWDKDPEVEIDYGDELSENEERECSKKEDNNDSGEDSGEESRKKESNQVDCSKGDDLLEGRIFSKSTTPQLPIGKRVSTSTRPGTSGVTGAKRAKEDSQEKGKKKMAIECDGDVELNLGNLVGSERMVKASDVVVKLRGGQLRVEVRY